LVQHREPSYLNDKKVGDSLGKATVV